MYLFDFDGTLLDSNGIWLEIDIDFLGAHGISPVPQDYTDYVTSHGFYEAAVYTRERYGLEETPEAIMEVWRSMGARAYGESLPLKAGARALLQRLYEAGEEVNLLTSCMPQLCRGALDRHGLTRYFTHVFTSSELGMEKGDSDTYRHVAALCEKLPQQCIFFDDAPQYCQSARAAGMEVIGVYDDLFAHCQGEMEEICHRYLKSLLEF